jgi:acyl phosphate:glycerol-3-phosphate acyltransferase
MSIYPQIAFVFLSYLVGSIPFGYLVTRYAINKNILELGSGNIGSTNVRRVIGKKFSVITQLLDMAKGFIPVAVFIFFGKDRMVVPEYYVYLIALATIIGHDFSIYLKFRGGKGVNTTQGASVLLAPYSAFIAAAVFYLVKWKFRYASVGSICLAITLPLTEIIIHGPTSTFYYLLVCMALIILRHRENIVRLINNRELTS